MPYIVDRGKIVPVNIDTKYESKPSSYKMNDLNSVFTHWDDKLKCNVPTENKINGGIDK